MGCAGGREAGGCAESSPGALNPHCASYPDDARNPSVTLGQGNDIICFI